MAPDPSDPISYIPLREGERIRNSWDGSAHLSDGSSSPMLLVLTNLRVVALQAANFQGFWDPKPTTWIAIVDRDLPDLPTVRFSDPQEGVVTLRVAGRTLQFSVGTAHGAREDIEHARVRALEAFAPQRSGPHEREVVIKEVVKIPCRFCGNLNLQSEKKCSSCGATIG